MNQQNSCTEEDDPLAQAAALNAGHASDHAAANLLGLWSWLKRRFANWSAELGEEYEVDPVSRFSSAERADLPVHHSVEEHK